MGASGRQLELMDLHAWFVGPSTGRTVYGAAPSTGSTPSTSRLTGPYDARLTAEARQRWDDEYAHQNPTGTLIMATTVAPVGQVVAALVSATTVPTAGRTYPVAGTRIYYDDVGVHHVTCSLGRSQ